MRFSTLLGGDWHLLGLDEARKLLSLILPVVLSWVLVVSSHACTAQESTACPGKPSAEIPCSLSAISSPVHSPVELPWFSQMLISSLLTQGVTRLCLYLCILRLPPHSLQTLSAPGWSHCSVICFVPSLRNPRPSLSDV